MPPVTPEVPPPGSPTLPPRKFLPPHTHRKSPARTPRHLRSPAGLYYVDSEGTRIPGAAFAVGSGSSYAYGVLDGARRHDMAEDEALELARRAIFQAARRDAYSGGRVTVYHVGPGGWRRVSTHDVAGLHDAYGQ